MIGLRRGTDTFPLRQPYVSLKNLVNIFLISIPKGVENA